MNDDCIQEDNGYREETYSGLSGLTDNANDTEQESEIATTSQVVVPDGPKRTPIVFEPASQPELDKPLDYHVQRTKERNMQNVAQQASGTTRMVLTLFCVKSGTLPEGIRKSGSPIRKGSGSFHLLKFDDPETFRKESGRNPEVR